MKDGDENDTTNSRRSKYQSPWKTFSLGMLKHPRQDIIAMEEHATCNHGTIVIAIQAAASSRARHYS